jgi:hypothetical protein
MPDMSFPGVVSNNSLIEYTLDTNFPPRYLTHPANQRPPAGVREEQATGRASSRPAPHSEPLSGPPHAMANPSVTSLRTAENQMPHIPNMRGSRRNLPGAGQGADQPPHLRWLLDGAARHANVAVRDASQVSNARRQFQRVLRSHGRNALYLHDTDSLGDFEQTIQVGSFGRLKLAAGPFTKLLNDGGTLILNVPNFSPQHLEAFNALLTDGVWQGKKLKRPVRLVFLCDVATLKKHVLSGAQISRVEFKDFSNVSFDDVPQPPIAQPRVRYEAIDRIIDFKSETKWRDLAYGAPELQPNGQWTYKPGFMENLPEGTLFLRNAPMNDPYFEDLVHELRSKKVRVRLEQGIPERRLKERLATKGPFTGRIEDLRAGAVCTVNASNIDMTLKPHYGIAPSGLTRQPSLLQQAQMRLGEGRRPVVHVCEQLPDQHWARLLTYPLPFDVAASPGVEVPDRYKAHVATLAGLRRIARRAAFDHDATAGTPVTFLLSADSALVDFPTDAQHIFVTPAMRADTLMCGVERTHLTLCERAAEGTLRPNGLSIKMGQMLVDLRAGRTVILHGHNPALEDDLATLLHWPHYYTTPDGRLWHFGEGGGLTGRLIAVTQHQAMLDKHALTPACDDGMNDDQAWTNAMIAKLAAAFPALAPQGHGNIAEQLRRTVCFFNTLTHDGLLPAWEHPVSYRTMEKLLRHLDPRQRAHAGDFVQEIWERIRPMVFKDMLLGDHRQSDPESEERYSRLKAILKALFPEQMSAMPRTSVDLARLENLLIRVKHPNDVCNNAYRFLNVFSPDVIRSIIGVTSPLPDRVEMPDDINDRILDWLHAQAPLVRPALRPLLTNTVALQMGGNVTSPSARRLTRYDRPPVLSPLRKNRFKTIMAQRQSGAVFKKGPPGTGKSASTTRHATKPYRANIATINSPEYEEVMEDWARDTEPRMLVVDEANLITDESSHDAFKAKFTNETILVNGVRHHLHPGKLIVFTGNADSYPGRKRSPMAAESFITQYFKPMKPEQLRTLFVNPLLEHAGDSRENEWLVQHAVNIHTALHHAYPEASLSPRNLEEYVCQVLSHRQRFPHAALAPWMFRLALNVYGGVLPAEDAPVIESWLRWTFGINSGEEPPALPHADLSQSGLLPTASTQALADEVLWWLDTQKLRQSLNPGKAVLGQRALLIEGPASRGKDAVVMAVLDAAHISYVRVNADPSDLKHLRTSLKNGCKKGKVVVIDELTNLPSGILEGELNAVLAGDHKVHRNFALIATVNPSGQAGGYAGRKPMSDALKNRMLIKKIDDYAPDELRAIAHHFSRNLSARQRGKIRFPAVPDSTIHALVRDHLGLAERLADVPDEFKPKLRELFRALEDVFRQPRLRYDAAFSKAYAYYLFQANKAGGSAPHRKQPADADRSSELAGQLRRAFMLVHPDWLTWPQIIADNTLLATRSVRYDAKEHCIRFNPGHELEQLCTAVLRIDMGDSHAPQPQAHQHDTHGPERRTTVRSPLDAPVAHAAAAGATHPWAPVTNFDPALPFNSAVGKETPKGDIGRVINAAGQELYLELERRTLGNEAVPFPRVRFENNQSALASTVSDIELHRVHVNRSLSGRSRVYLLASNGTRPAGVRLDGIMSGSIRRDDYGGWYVNFSTSEASIDTVRYSLVPFHEEGQGGRNRKAGYQLFSGLEFSSEGREAMQAILALQTNIKKSGVASYSAKKIAAALAKIFLDPRYFQYSHDDADALNNTNGIAARCQRFLEQGEGVCVEFAYAFAAVLEQLFHIPARVCGGHRVKSETIPAASHTWVEYENEKGNWIRIDPTPVDLQASYLQGETASRFHSALISSVSTIFQTKSFYNIDRQHLDISQQLLKQHFDPATLDLAYWDTERATKTYNAVAGTLDLKRYMQGKPDFYLDSRPSTSLKHRAIYIESLPEQSDAKEWIRFLVRMVRPIQALIHSDIQIYYYGSIGELLELKEAPDIQHALPIPDSSARKRNDDESALRVTGDSKAYLDRIAATYYEAVLDYRNVDRNDEKAVMDCLIEELWFFVDKLSKSDDGLPIQIPLHGRTLSITKEAVLTGSIAINNRKFLREINLRIEDLIQRGMNNADIVDKLVEATNVAVLNRVNSYRPTISTKLQLLRDILVVIQEICHDSNRNRMAPACMNVAIFLTNIIKTRDIDSPPASADEWLAQFLSGYLAEANQDLIDQAIAILGVLPAMPRNSGFQEKGDELVELVNDSLSIKNSQKAALSAQCRRILG